MNLMSIDQIEAFLLAQIHVLPGSVSSDLPGLFQSGPSRWYALRVAPQREDQVEGWLRLRGVYAFHPIQTFTTRRCGVSRDYHRRYLPGYVFARFMGDPAEHRVMGCPWIIGALCRSDGEWGVLEPRKMAAIHAMRKIDEKAEAERLRQRAVPVFQIGDAVVFRGGALVGGQCEVVELKAEGGVTVCLRLFGRETLVNTQAHDLKPIVKAS